jgi:hypothetical protein
MARDRSEHQTAPHSTVIVHCGSSDPSATHPCGYPTHWRRRCASFYVFATGPLGPPSRSSSREMAYIGARTAYRKGRK